MPYSQTLFERIRDIMSHTPYKLMFGGVCFFVRGHIAVGVFGDGMLVRLAPQRHAELIGQSGITPLASHPKRMRGFVVIDESLLDDDESIHEWLDQSLEFIGSCRGGREQRVLGRKKSSKSLLHVTWLKNRCIITLLR